MVGEEKAKSQGRSLFTMVGVSQWRKNLHRQKMRVGPVSL